MERHAIAHQVERVTVGVEDVQVAILIQIDQRHA